MRMLCIESYVEPMVRVLSMSENHGISITKHDAAEDTPSDGFRAPRNGEKVGRISELSKAIGLLRGDDPCVLNEVGRLYAGCLYRFSDGVVANDQGCLAQLLLNVQEACGDGAGDCVRAWYATVDAIFTDHDEEYVRACRVMANGQGQVTTALLSDKRALFDRVASALVKKMWPPVDAPMTVASGSKRARPCPTEKQVTAQHLFDMPYP